MKLIVEQHFSRTVELEVPDDTTREQAIKLVLDIQDDVLEHEWCSTDVFKETRDPEQQEQWFDLP